MYTCGQDSAMVVLNVMWHGESSAREARAKILVYIYIYIVVYVYMCISIEVNSGERCTSLTGNGGRIF